LRLEPDVDSERYAEDTLAPVAGYTVGGRIVGTAHHYYGGDGQPIVAIWYHRDAMTSLPGQVLSGEVVAASDGRVDVRCDDGTTMGRLPLFLAPGYVTQPASGTRVLVLDLGDDPRATVALCGADGGVEASETLGPAITLADGESEIAISPTQAVGRVVRYGDTIADGAGVPGAPLVVTLPVPGKAISRVRA
jgi:hypothetical protein